MEDRLIQFISALRAGGVRISMAESADAFLAIENLGVTQRETFRLSLRTTLVKDQTNLPIFDELFPLFFDRADTSPMMDVTEDMSPEEAQMLAQALRMFNKQLQKLLEKLLRGEQLNPDELRQLGDMVGLNQQDDLRYRDWMTRRMQQALQFDAVRDALREMMETLAQMGMNKERIQQLMGLIQDNQNALEEQLRQYAGQRIGDNMANQPPEENDTDRLMNRPFGALDDRDMQRLRREVRRLANRLRSRIALRQKRAKSGQLDAKATIRANLKYGGVPVELRHRNRRLKPKLVVICDISTSMRHCSELMLALVHALQDLITKTQAFTFIDHLEYITPDFTGRDVNEAIDQVLIRMPPGYYSTDLGYALTNFERDYMDTIDSRTTLIMVGDGRNNYNNPHLDVFAKMARRSRRTLWINPEPIMMWNSGDSDMARYAPLCDHIVVAGTLAELTDAVDHFLGEP